MNLFFIPALLALLIAIVLPDGSTYVVTATQVNATTWTYHVDRTAGKDLSHWVLSLGTCAGAVVGTQPPASYGTDPTTGATGWKFEPITNQSATYTITLDGEYPAGAVTVTMKAGTLGNYASAAVAGPNCTQAVTPTATVTPTAPPEVPPTTTATPTPTETATMTPTGIATSAATPAPTETTTATPTATGSATTTPTPTTTLEPTGIGDGNEPARWWAWLPWGRR